MQLIRSITVIVMLLYGVAFGAPLKGGIPATLPNLQVNSQGQLVGENRDLHFIDCISDSLQQEIVWSALPTARLIEEVKNNKIDIIFPMGFTQQRRAQLIESKAIQVIHDYWVYQKHLPDMSDKEITIGVKLGSPQASYVQQQDFENIVKHNDYTGLYKMLLANRVQVVALPDMAYKGLVDKFGLGLTQYTAFLQRGYGFYLTPKAGAKLVTRVNQAVVLCRP